MLEYPHVPSSRLWGPCTDHFSARMCPVPSPLVVSHESTSSHLPLSRSIQGIRFFFGKTTCFTNFHGLVTSLYHLHSMFFRPVPMKGTSPPIETWIASISSSSAKEISHELCREPEKSELKLKVSCELGWDMAGCWLWLLLFEHTSPL
jgi:hypothetical protein